MTPKGKVTANTLKKGYIQNDLDNLEKQSKNTEVIFSRAEYKVLHLRRMTEVKIEGKSGQVAGNAERISVYCELETKYELHSATHMQKLENQLIFSTLVISQMRY